MNRQEGATRYGQILDSRNTTHPRQAGNADMGAAKKKRHQNDRSTCAKKGPPPPEHFAEKRMGGITSPYCNKTYSVHI